jgi:hypothetical protein
MIDVRLIKAILKGIITFIPGVSFFTNIVKKKTKHSGANAEFCYSLWLSILVHLKENGINPDFEKVGELGSGGSAGVGICALLTGTNQFYALEIEDHFDLENNLKLLDEIVSLLQNETMISQTIDQLNIRINDNQFPSDLIKPRYIDNDFINEIREDINSFGINSRHLHFIYNWQEKPSLKLDLVLSRAVMEHVAEPKFVYKQLLFNLNKCSYMFHDIEFHSHGITGKTGRYMEINSFVWQIIYGKRDYFLNRWNLDKHLYSLKKFGFEIVKVNKIVDTKSEIKELLIGATILVKFNK